MSRLDILFNAVETSIKNNDWRIKPATTLLAWIITIWFMSAAFLLFGTMGCYPLIVLMGVATEIEVSGATHWFALTIFGLHGLTSLAILVCGLIADIWVKKEKRAKSH